MTYHRLEFPHLESRLSPPRAPGRGALKRALGGRFAPLAAWNREQLAAARLQKLSPHMRADIGLTRAASSLIFSDIEGVTHQLG